MILTFKIKHNKDFNKELKMAKEIAVLCVQDKEIKTSKHVKFIGLKSIISNQILRKYGKNKNIKQVHSVNLIIPNQGIKWTNKEIYIPSLKFKIEYKFNKEFYKINQIEINKEFLFVSVTVREEENKNFQNWIGIDLNSTKHICVIANPQTGKIWKFGKEAPHIKKKYRKLREKCKSNKFKNKLGKRETNKIKDLNHKISRKIIDIALKEKCNIKLENLKGVTRKNVIKTNKKNKNQSKAREINASLNSWSFYQLRQMIEYKAKLLGIKISLINPAYTSKQCSKCGHVEDKVDIKAFICSKCNHVDHRDVNAAFNIANKQIEDQLLKDRDLSKSLTDSAQREEEFNNNLLNIDIFGTSRL